MYYCLHLLLLLNMGFNLQTRLLGAIKGYYRLLNDYPYYSLGFLLEGFTLVKQLKTLFQLFNAPTLS